MAYRLTQDEQIMDGVRRIGHEQTSKALDQLDRAAGAEDFEQLRDSIHACRKHCKKLRGLVRLVRPGMEDVYQHSNRSFRDAARELGPVRDAHAIADTFDDLLEIDGAGAPAGAAEAGEHLRDAAGRMSKEEIGDRIADARALITQGVDLIASWEVDNALGAVEAGVAKTHKRSRKRFEELETCVETATLHEWRKRVKYGWYHTRLLRDAAPSMLAPQASLLHDLSDALGDDHDLAIVDERLADSSAGFGDIDVDDVRRWVAGWRWDLQSRALSLGSRLTVETRSAYGARMVRYLHAWETHGAERHAGDVTAIARSDGA